MIAIYIWLVLRMEIQSIPVENSVVAGIYQERKAKEEICLEWVAEVIDVASWKEGIMHKYTLVLRLGNWATVGPGTLNGTKIN